MIELIKLQVTTTGSAGSATGTATTDVEVHGEIKAVVLDYHASAPNTTDVELYPEKTSSYKILDYDNKNTDIGLHPRKQSCKSDGTLLTLDGTREKTEVYVVADKLVLSVAGCNALTNAVVAYILYDGVVKAL